MIAKPTRAAFRATRVAFDHSRLPGRMTFQHALLLPVGSYLLNPPGLRSAGFCFKLRHFYMAEAGVLRFECSSGVGVACPG